MVIKLIKHKCIIMDIKCNLQTSDDFEKKLEQANVKLKEKIKQLKESVLRVSFDARKSEITERELDIRPSQKDNIKVYIDNIRSAV